MARPIPREAPVTIAARGLLLSLEDKGSVTLAEDVLDVFNGERY